MVHGGWSLWQPWGSCTRSCNSGSQRRFRTCNNPSPRNGGSNCQGANVQSRSCNTNVCAGKSVQAKKKTKNKKTLLSKKRFHLMNMLETLHSVEITLQLLKCGSPFYLRWATTHLVYHRKTFLYHIFSAVNGGWSAWSPWGSCSRTCGSGAQRRTRACTNPPPGRGGATCSGGSFETRQCNTNPCSGMVSQRPFMAHIRVLAFSKVNLF